MLTEMKNILQRINGGVDETEIKTDIWKTRKQKTPNQNSKKKKESKRKKNPKKNPKMMLV